MGKIYLNILLIAIVGLAVIASGCTGGQDVSSVVKALPEVQQFMKEHPNAQITVTYWSKEEVAQAAQGISQQCDKPITPVAMYKATVSEGDLKIVSWINAENQIVLCSTTTGGASPIATPKSGNQANEFKIINLDVQQVILGESEIKEVIGSDWEWANPNQNKSVAPGHSQLMMLEYLPINWNTREQKGEQKIIRIRMMVSPNISFTKEFYSSIVGEAIRTNISENDIDIGDAGMVITDKVPGEVDLWFIKNNVLVSIMFYFSQVEDGHTIGGSTTVGLETVNKLARKQEEKIIRILENPTSASVFTPIPTMVVHKTVPIATESAATIAENLVVEAIDGNATAAGTLSNISITVRPAAGSSDIDLSKVLLKVSSSPYTYSTTTIRKHFHGVFIKGSKNGLNTPINTYTATANPTLQSGALARLDVGGLSFASKASITISLTPEKGSTFTLPVTLPAIVAGTNAIYP